MSNNFNVLDESISLIGSRNLNEATTSAYGQLIVGERKDNILCRFEYSNSTQDVTVTTSGTGTSTNANSMAVASSGSGVGSCKFVTNRCSIYRPAHEVYFFGTSVFSSGEAGVSQRLGVYDDNDGFFFGYNELDFGINLRKGTVDTFVPQTEWNVDKLDGYGEAPFILDPTKNNQYSITYGWLGISPIYFYVYCGAKIGWRVVHIIDLINSQTTPSILSPSLPVRWEVIRSSGTGAKTVSVGSVSSGTTEGMHSHAGHRVFAGRAEKTLVAGTPTLIATFRNKSVYATKQNKVAIEAVFFGGATDGTKSVEFQFYRNSTLAGHVWTDVNTADSVTEYSTAGSVTGGLFEFSVPLAKVDTIALDLGAGHFHLELLPGESMSVVGLSAGASDIIIAFRWEEYFS